MMGLNKTKNRVTAVATSNDLSTQVRHPGYAGIFTAELLALKMAYTIVTHCDRYSFIH